MDVLSRACLLAMQSFPWLDRKSNEELAFFVLTLQSDAHVILASLKRAPSELSSYTQKIFKIDDHMGIATAGLAADGRILCRYMRNECINHRRAACTFFALQPNCRCPSCRPSAGPLS